MKIKNNFSNFIKCFISSTILVCYANAATFSIGEEEPRKTQQTKELEEYLDIVITTKKTQPNINYYKKFSISSHSSSKEKAVAYIKSNKYRKVNLTPEQIFDKMYMEVEKNFSVSKEEKIHIVYILLSMITVESSYNKDTIGDGGLSTGLMQVYAKSYNYYYGTNYSATQLRALISEENKNIEIGVEIFSQKKKEFIGELKKTLNLKEYISFLSQFTDDFYFIKNAPFVSLYNGGTRNKTYITKVYKEYEKLKNM